MNRSNFSDYSTRLREFIQQSLRPALSPGFLCLAEAEHDFNALALALFDLQFRFNPPYRRFCQAREASPALVSHWSEIPPIPTSAFKELDLTSLSPAERATVFHSSGTTDQRPSRHFHNDESLRLYEASLLPWFRAQFLADLWPYRAEGKEPEVRPRRKMLFFTPSSAQAPHSSLAYMFEAVRREFGTSDSLFAGGVEADGAWSLHADHLRRELESSGSSARPVALLGTAFNFVHLLDAAARQGERFPLPPGSRVLETGGYKGRSRVLPKPELHTRISELFSIPQEQIGCEYGMCELSSQAYTTIVQSPKSKVQSPTPNVPGASRAFHFPPWARVRVVSPETGREVEPGEPGLIQVFDLANARSVMAVQTQDLAVRRGAGFELLGRAGLSEPRGCSLMTMESGASPFAAPITTASSGV